MNAPQESVDSTLKPLRSNRPGSHTIRRHGDKSLAFPIFLFAAQSKEFFLDLLKKLEQPSHNTFFFNP
jgi:hypothetical protein